MMARSSPNPTTLVPHEVLNVEKMAEVILDFAKPLIADLHDDSDEAFNTVITVAVTVWNIAQSPEEMQDTFITELSEGIAAQNPAAVGEIQEVVALLLKRKQELY